MTKDEQRIAIGEACGYVWYRIPKNQFEQERRYRFLAHPLVHEYEDQSPLWLERADGTEHICNMQFMEKEGHLPDYVFDLNAMHEAEKLLTQGGKTQYIFVLQTLCGGQQFGDNYFATAEQRAEAFLRVVGRWKEDAAK
jgi:hypothetical protein